MEPAPPSSAESEPIEVIDLTGLSDSSSDDDRQHDGSDDDEDGDDRSSTSSGFEITLDETARARLHDAISTVSEERLRRVVHALANTVPAAEEALIQELITLKRKARDEDGDEEAPNGNGNRVPAGVVVPRWEMCGNCGEEFDVGDVRGNEECVFHPGASIVITKKKDQSLTCRFGPEGELEVNEEEFHDWDEDCHGPKDTTENRRSFPQNFTWTCCDENGVGEGCVHGHHRAAVARKKRRM